MPASWERALSKYSYPVNLADFADAAKYPGWFECDTGAGGLTETTAFENRFRKLAPNHVEAWYEVVFWKMASQGRRDVITRNAIEKIMASGVTTGELWSLCRAYTKRQDVEAFRRLREKLVASRSIAVAATFPAFLDPGNFPMVDRLIANWVRKNRASHSYAQSGVVLSRPPMFTPNKTVLTEGDWGFVQSWINWCRHTRDILNKRCKFTKRDWTARQVEMAVFTAQRDGLTLKPL